MALRDLHAIQSGTDQSLAGAAARLGLAALTPGYAAANAARMAMFNAGLRKPTPLGRPTVSVGNLTAGGSGKTPMTVALGQWLAQQGARPGVLTRGYGDDETHEMRALLGDAASVHANPKRVLGAQEALRSDPTLAAFVLDDGFQHRQAARDVDLVLIDALQPWGHGHLLPRGLLREPVSALRRADAAIVTRADQVDEAALQAIEDRVEQVAPSLPLARTAFAWTELRDHQGAVHPPESLADLAVYGVCGLGNPLGFRRQLEAAAGNVAGFQALPDHHAYTPQDVGAFIARAQAAGARAIVTTGKDWAKLARLTPAQGWPMPVLRPVLGVRWLAGEDAVFGRLSAVLERPNAAPA
ncbi:MAG: tetraacyldisaccharide 4'-kinase [Planctomycetota bacterium]